MSLDNDMLHSARVEPALRSGPVDRPDAKDASVKVGLAPATIQTPNVLSVLRKRRAHKEEGVEGEGEGTHVVPGKGLLLITFAACRINSLSSSKGCRLVS